MAIAPFARDVAGLRARRAGDSGGEPMFDTVIRGGHLLTMAGEGVGFVEDGAVAIRGHTLVAVGPRTEVEAQGDAREIIDATDCLVMPGLIDAHLHSSALFQRGRSVDVAGWTREPAAPLPALGRKDAWLATTLALIEGVSSGTTTFADVGLGMAECVQAHVTMGNRAIVAEAISEQRPRPAGPGELPGIDVEAGRDAVERALALAEQWDGFDGGRLSVALSPESIDRMSTSTLLRIVGQARQLGLPLRVPVARHLGENSAALVRHGLRTVPYLDHLGVLGPDLIVTHLGAAADDEVELVVRRGARLVACGASMVGGDGSLPPLALFKALGGAVALGSDEAAFPQTHNMFSQMRAVALCACARQGGALAMPPWQILRSATIEGARVLGIDAHVGSLEPGKAADLIMLDLTRPPLAPLMLRPARNLVPNLVAAETGRNVLMSMVGGRVIYRDGRFAHVDPADVHRQLCDALSRQPVAAAPIAPRSLEALTLAGLL